MAGVLLLELVAELPVSTAVACFISAARLLANSVRGFVLLRRAFSSQNYANMV
jgi:hypothetical protein